MPQDFKPTASMLAKLAQIDAIKDAIAEECTEEGRKVVLAIEEMLEDDGIKVEIHSGFYSPYAKFTPPIPYQDEFGDDQELAEIASSDNINEITAHNNVIAEIEARLQPIFAMNLWMDEHKTPEFGIIDNQGEMVGRNPQPEKDPLSNCPPMVSASAYNVVLNREIGE
ncbi:MAG: hypothetical protein EOP83_04645 [Verrucomicrobiaceae bacterium]|nr:MAG: hypothetical protein EOP83_04645 [Verrucomicrobiaceae bacterium]